MTDVAVHDGDGWTICRHGHRHWGRFGAAGLLLRDDAEVILQHRAEWTHEGGAWGLPGGARDSHEDAVQAALREAAEEADIAPESARPTGYYVDDHGGWSYTTFIAHARGPVAPVARTRESTEIRWWPRALVPRLPLHSGLAAHWPALDAASDDVHLLVDAANVVGSRPDGWWRDRVGAATRLLGQLAQLARDGIAAVELPTTSAKLTRVLPRITVVVEGAARGASGPAARLAGGGPSGCPHPHWRRHRVAERAAPWPRVTATARPSGPATHTAVPSGRRAVAPAEPNLRQGLDQGAVVGAGCQADNTRAGSVQGGQRRQ
jgi:8-oxo-dGTP pyrophosphatase MutT (NUDIX family)